MKRALSCIVLCITLFILGGCQSLWYQFLKLTVNIPQDRFIVEVAEGDGAIPVLSSHPLTAVDDAVEQCILIVHGAGLNVEKTFGVGVRMREALGIPEDRALVVAPQFLEGVEPDDDGILVWSREWRSGGDSVSGGHDPALHVSSYTVLDALLNTIAERYPSMQRIIIAGHSAGGQFVERYAALNDIHESLGERRISVQYIVSNASSHLYLDATRYHIGEDAAITETTAETLAQCPDYNSYKYGPEALYGYAEGISPESIRRRLLSRPVVFLIGAEDTDRSWSLDTSCEADSQGANRHQRWLLYKHHLQRLPAQVAESIHAWIEIPGVGHDAAEMFTHPVTIEALHDACVR